MANAQQILARKDGNVVMIDPDATVLDAARMMNEHRIGSLVVAVDGELAGIFTERDIMRRVVADQKDPARTRVREVMTTPVACATPQTTSDELAITMREKRIRHIPVIDDGKVVGMVSIGDINRAQHHVHEQTISYLQQYMSVT
jgi:CBS domain-containing protein